MKKIILMCAMTVFGLTSISAQSDDSYVLNHLSVGVGLGVLTGATVEVAAPVTSYFTLRAGYNFFPKLSGSTNLDLDFVNVDAAYRNQFTDKEIEVEGEVDFGTAHVLLDIHPFKGNSFRVTAGAYFGKSDVINLNNKKEGALQNIYDFNHRVGAYSMVPNDAGRIGIDLGDYFLEPDAQGNMDATIKVKAFRPYVGIGFGRAVPQKRRFASNFDLGVQFWNTPGVYLQGQKLEKQDVGDEGSKFYDIMSKVRVCPVIAFRLTGRIL